MIRRACLAVALALLLGAPAAEATIEHCDKDWSDCYIVGSQSWGEGDCAEPGPSAGAAHHREHRVRAWSYEDDEDDPVPEHEASVRWYCYSWKPPWGGTERGTGIDASAWTERGSVVVAWWGGEWQSWTWCTYLVGVWVEGEGFVVYERGWCDVVGPPPPPPVPANGIHPPP